jgi:hypothetical protein
MVLEAVDIVLRNLAELPDGADARKVREKALAYIKEAEGWRDHPPSVEKREALMKKVLGLHTAVSRLGHGNS